MVVLQNRRGGKKSMVNDILKFFPPYTHPLTLVSDPDRLLAGETLISELVRRGFELIQENDPVLLRHQVEAARPFTREHPVIILTSGALEALPYDLYQPAHRLNLSLHDFFPTLAYPVLQSLTPDQIEKLAACQLPEKTLSRRKTMDYLLEQVFHADPHRLGRPHTLVAWLNDYHHSGSPLPEMLRAALVERLSANPEYEEWDLSLLILDSQAFSDFIQLQWQESVTRSLPGEQIKETGTKYQVPFHQDLQLQNLVPGLVRSGAIRPVKITASKRLPNWAAPGVTLVDERIQRYTTLLETVNNRLAAMSSAPQTDWNTWSELARNWAELCCCPAQIELNLEPVQLNSFREAARKMDGLFMDWLKSKYTALGAQRLPRPHHVHHIPHYLAYLRSLGQIQRAVYLVLDGLSLADWQIIQPVWTKRNPDWKLNGTVLLAQVPTITAISRYALISGLRPADFSSNLSEARAWELFWSREGVSEAACKLLALQYDRQIDQQAELLDPLVSFWCLIDDTIDKLTHHATFGTADQQASLRLWLEPAGEQNSLLLEEIIDAYLERGFSVFIASDHGHVEAKGIGQPSEGLLAQTRGKRARLYRDKLAALRVQSAFANTIRWDGDGILPDQVTALMPAAREAFAPAGETVVTHGGITIDEVMVPFVQILKEGI